MASFAGFWHALVAVCTGRGRSSDSDWVEPSNAITRRVLSGEQILVPRLSPNASLDPAFELSAELAEMMAGVNQPADEQAEPKPGKRSAAA